MDEAPGQTWGFDGARGGVDPENHHAQSSENRRPERETGIPLPPVDSRYLGGVPPGGAPASVELFSSENRVAHRS